MTAIPGFRVAVLASFVLLGVAGAARAQIEPGGSLRYGELQSVRVLNPYASITRSGGEDRILSMLYESLVRYDHTREVYEPVLAASLPEIRIEPDGSRSVTVTTRENAVWHDGVPFTPADVVFTFRYIAQVSTDPVERRDYSEKVDTVYVAGPRSVVVQFTPDVTDPLFYLETWILPAHLFDDQFVPTGTDVNRSPVGTGPYRFEQRTVSGREIDLARADHHTQSGNLETIVMSRYTDPLGMIEDLASQSVDALNLAVEVMPEYLPRIREEDHLRTGENQSFSIYVLAFRIEEGSILANPAVREALTLAVDRQYLLDQWWGGVGEVLAGPLGRGAPSFNDQIEVPPFDPDRARALLAEAGVGPGTPNLTLMYPRDLGAQDTRVVNSVRDLETYFEDVGLDIELEAPEQDDYEVRLRRDGDFDIAWVRWEFSPEYDIRPLFHSEFVGTGGWNVMNYSNQQLDRVLNEAATTTDPVNERTLMYRAQELIATDDPALFLFTVKSHFAHHANYVIDPVDPFRFFDEVAQWFRIR